ncbi:hypothetical protein [Pseudovibrio sp. SPO723]|uniref:hypothetical protein n=1 Tax=Nesiotobacter zosterae TaxID=392721 RepID=UPI0029C1F5C1|nr:hypothetical protein [Pseudovibrio sp. SPO723]MDX5594321.1 hypothetical protein [Pseudovibrio sp. SPO723]
MTFGEELGCCPHVSQQLDRVFGDIPAFLLICPYGPLVCPARGASPEEDWGVLHAAGLSRAAAPAIMVTNRRGRIG